ncbi:MAG: xylulokinase [Fibrobacterota bacterium]|nr:xylulokinase [Fibrobacterota bacterium]
MTFLGIDLGTSAVKAILVDENQNLIEQASAPLSVSRLHPLWSEQDPEEWWTAANQAVLSLRASRPREFAGIKAIGLSGQMHGATLLGRQDRVLRPAILWNDGRSAAECLELERRVPESRKITGNLAMPGFTAPKLMWVARHEPDTFGRVERVLLPKDYLRMRMCGNYASDMSDSSGTLWLDVGKRAWSDELLEATGLKRSAMPELYEGTQATGKLTATVAASWGLSIDVIVAAGAGDNAAGAAGAGVVRPGDGFLSLGTSGVYFAAAGSYSANPEGAVHTFCHCLPNAWHQMSVILSAASSLTWVAKLTGAADESTLLAEIESESNPGSARDSLIFLPYLSGERTPHNNPLAQGVFFGMTHETTRASLGRAVLEGVAFAFADGQRALLDARADLRDVSVIGGGARSLLWGRIIASVLKRPLLYRKGGEAGPAYGAARLARLAFTGEEPEAVCTAPTIDHIIQPETDWAGEYERKLALYRNLYFDLKPRFNARL